MDLQAEDKKIKNLFVVDWKSTTSQALGNLFTNTKLPGSEWKFYNCYGKKYKDIGVLNLHTRYIFYFRSVLHILKNKKKYDNIIIWQPMIGFILCLLPKFYSNPKIIITSLLYSPDRVKAGSFRLFLLKKALKKADALLYFSEDMAQNVRESYPQYAFKVFSTYLPISNNTAQENRGTRLNESSKDSVFSGGFSDRDFETIIRAFTGTHVPVTIVCTKTHIFRDPELITSNFTIVRDVSEKEYYALALNAGCVVVALENEYSSCGQLLFTFCMKNGIPVIATNCYGTRDYIRNGDNGILVPVKGDRAIFEAYKRLVDDTGFRERLVERSIEISGKMTFDNYLHKIDFIIQQIKKTNDK
ncbi:MAG: glycosyltransferase [Ferruginibacter sp.]